MDSVFYCIHTRNPYKIPVIRYSWYPEVAALEKNNEYAKILSADLAASQSEMTSVHQYLFQSWNIEHQYATIQNVISRIAQVEIHHFNIIGKLITCLGGEARCSTTQKNNVIIWNGSMVNYTTQVKEMVEINIEAERGASDAYFKQSKQIKDPLVSKMLYRLSLDEELHYDIFKSFLSQI